MLKSRKELLVGIAGAVLVEFGWWKITKMELLLLNFEKEGDFEIVFERYKVLLNLHIE